MRSGQQFSRSSAWTPRKLPAARLEPPIGYYPETALHTLKMKMRMEEVSFEGLLQKAVDFPFYEPRGCSGSTSIASTQAIEAHPPTGCNQNMDGKLAELLAKKRRAQEQAEDDEWGSTVSRRPTRLIHQISS